MTKLSEVLRILKITFLLTQSLESPGGGGRYLPLAKALAHRGYSVSILALHHDYLRLKEKKFLLNGIPVQYVGQMHVRKVGNQKTYFSTFPLLWITFVATIRLFWTALWVPADVVQVCKTQPMNGLAAWGVHFLRGIPVILDSDDYETVNNRFAHRWQQVIVAKFETWMPSFAKGIMAGTSFIAKQFITKGFPKNRIELVPNGVDRARFAILDDVHFPSKMQELQRSLAIIRHHKVVVYVGSMSLVSHAVDLLLEAFANVVANKPDAVLILAGAGEDFDFLQQFAKRLGIAGNVRFVGRIPGDEIPYYYRLGTVSVDPMRRTLQAESSLSLKVLESIAAGVPCVTADIGDRKKMIGEAGLAVTPDDVMALTNGILHVLNDETVAEKMRQAALKIREENWWDKRVDLCIALYDQVKKS